MQRQRERLASGRVAKPAAAALALLLLLAATCSVNHSFHASLHQGDASHPLCLLCSLAHGQVSAAEPTLVGAVLVLVLLFSVPSGHLFLLADFNYRLSPSRAPPCR